MKLSLRLNSIKKRLPWGTINRLKSFMCDNFGHVPDWKTHYHKDKEHPDMKPRSVVYVNCKRCKLLVTTSVSRIGWQQVPGIDKETR